MNRASKITLIVAIIILFLGCYTYSEGVRAKKIAFEWVDESGKEIDRLSDELDEVKAICSGFIEPVYPDSGNDFSDNQWMTN